MRKIHFLLTLALTYISLFAVADDATTLWLGNCASGLSNAEQVNKNNSLGYAGGSALYFSEDYLKPYIGCKIEQIAIAVYDYTAIDSLTLFIAPTLEAVSTVGAEECSDAYILQSVVPEKNKWNTFVLESTYIITGEPFYLGYMQAGNLYLYYTQQRESDASEYYCKARGAWTDYTKQLSAAVYGILSGDNLPQHNVRLRSATIPQYAVTGEPIDIELTVANIGAATISTLDIAVNDDLFSVEVDMAYKDEQTITLNQFTINAEGEYEVAVSIAAVNGYNDDDPRDNTLGTTQQVIVRDEFVQRKVLLELFSTEKCSSCPRAHTMLDTILDEQDDVIEICHHAGYYTDQFTIDASEEYTWFYDYETTYNQYSPAVMLDRTNFYDYYPGYCDYRVPFISPGYTTTKVATCLAKALEQPAYVAIELTAEIDGESIVTTSSSGDRASGAVSQLTVSVTITQLLPIAADDLRLTVFLTEDSLATDNQSGATGTFIYNATPRACLTDAWGEKLSDGTTNIAPWSTTLALDSNWQPKNLNVVAFVSQYTADDRNACDILNAAKHSFAPPTSDDNNDGNNNDGDGITTIQHLIPNVPNQFFNATGQRVSSTTRGLIITHDGRKVVK